MTQRPRRVVKGLVAFALAGAISFGGYYMGNSLGKADGLEEGIAIGQLQKQDEAYQMGFADGSAPLTRLKELTAYDSAPGFLPHSQWEPIVRLDVNKRVEMYWVNRETRAFAPITEKAIELNKTYAASPNATNLCVRTVGLLGGR